MAFTKYTLNMVRERQETMQWQILPPQTPQLQNLLVGKADAKLLDIADCLRVFCTYVGNVESNISHKITLSLFTIFAVKCCQVLLFSHMSFPNSIPDLLSDFRFWNNFGKFGSFTRDFSPLSLSQTKQLQLCQSPSGYEFPYAHPSPTPWRCDLGYPQSPGKSGACK